MVEPEDAIAPEGSAERGRASNLRAGREEDPDKVDLDEVE
jgi:hypothetical protein